jgi:hypothetical protein
VEAREAISSHHIHRKCLKEINPEVEILLWVRRQNGMEVYQKRSTLLACLWWFSAKLTLKNVSVFLQTLQEYEDGAQIIPILSLPVLLVLAVTPWTS